MAEKFSEESCRGIKVPGSWTYCFNGQCPKHNECIRFITGKYVDDACDRGSCVLPNACRDGRECRYFKQARIVSFAWGFNKLFYDVKQRDASLLRLLLKAYLGSHATYYRYADGRNKLTPEQQQGIINIFKKKGYTENLIFDHYEKNVDLS